MAAAANHKRDRVAWPSAAVPGTVRSICAQDTLCPWSPEDSRKDWIWGGSEEEGLGNSGKGKRKKAVLWKQWEVLGTAKRQFLGESRKILSPVP